MRPQMASLYAAIGLPVNLRGLTFEDVDLSHASHDGVPLLSVEGRIVNVRARQGRGAAAALCGARHRPAREIYCWTAQPPQAALEAGASLPFRSRLASPPEKAHSVAVRFFHQRDALADLFRRRPKHEPSMARILIAEDEASLRDSWSRALGDDGHETVACADGAAALDCAGRTRRFDLLLTDIKMPIMDGIALALAAARDHPGLPVLLMTGYADQRERAAGLEAIVRDVLAKPFSIAALRGAVTRCARAFETWLAPSMFHRIV